MTKPRPAERNDAETPRRRAYHHGDLREALIEAGLELLAKSGDRSALGLREAARLGFRRAIIPRANMPRQAALEGLELVPVERIGDVIASMRG